MARKGAGNPSGSDAGGVIHERSQSDFGSHIEFGSWSELLECFKLAANLLKLRFKNAIRRREIRKLSRKLDHLTFKVGDLTQKASALRPELTRLKCRPIGGKLEPLPQDASNRILPIRSWIVSLIPMMARLVLGLQRVI